jgi:hypothetical protein
VGSAPGLISNQDVEVFDIQFETTAGQTSPSMAEGRKIGDGDEFGVEVVFRPSEKTDEREVKGLYVVHSRGHSTCRPGLGILTREKC